MYVCTYTCGYLIVCYAYPMFTLYNAIEESIIFFLFPIFSYYALPGYRYCLMNNIINHMTTIIKNSYYIFEVILATTQCVICISCRI